VNVQRDYADGYGFGVQWAEQDARDGGGLSTDWLQTFAEDAETFRGISRGLRAFYLGAMRGYREVSRSLLQGRWGT
jgi:hypothetical protein